MADSGADKARMPIGSCMAGPDSVQPSPGTTEAWRQTPAGTGEVQSARSNAMRIAFVDKLLVLWASLRQCARWPTSGSNALLIVVITIATVVCREDRCARLGHGPSRVTQSERAASGASRRRCSSSQRGLVNVPREKQRACLI